MLDINLRHRTRMQSLHHLFGMQRRTWSRKIVEESEADVVIHTAAISDIGTCQKDPQSSYFANVQIPLYLAAACKDRKLICFSSDQVYSACKEEGPYIEDVVKPGKYLCRA